MFLLSFMLLSSFFNLSCLRQLYAKLVVFWNLWFFVLPFHYLVLSNLSYLPPTSFVLFLHFKLQLWFMLFVSLETITRASCWVACCYVTLETVIGGFYWTSCCCVRLEMSFMLLCELGDYYRKFVLSFMLLHELGNEFHVAMWTWKLLQEVCVELCIEPCIAMWAWRLLQEVCVELCIELCIASRMLL